MHTLMPSSHSYIRTNWEEDMMVKLSKGSSRDIYNETVEPLQNGMMNIAEFWFLWLLAGEVSYRVGSGGKSRERGKIGWVVGSWLNLVISFG